MNHRELIFSLGEAVLFIDMGRANLARHSLRELQQKLLAETGESVLYDQDANLAQVGQEGKER